MYSRSKDRPDYTIQPPRHYSGWAFPPPSTRSAPPPSDEPLASPSPAPLPLPTPTLPPVQEEKKEAKETQEEEKRDTPVSLPKPPPPPAFLQPFQSLFGNIGNAFPFAHGLGFDEILILGLMILLAQNDHDPDILLLLGLLLFCG